MRKGRGITAASSWHRPRCGGAPPPVGVAMDATVLPFFFLFFLRQEALRHQMVVVDRPTGWAHGPPGGGMGGGGSGGAFR